MNRALNLWHKIQPAQSVPHPMPSRQMNQGGAGGMRR